MNIISSGEFGYEMVLVVPYAYWLYSQNLLTSTTSCIDTKPLYYFSKNHKEVFTKRDDCIGRSTSISGASFNNLHIQNPNFTKWKFPDYKNHFKNDVFIYDKPLMIISNKRYSNGSTQRYGSFTDEQLEVIFNLFKNDYQLIYNRAKSNKITVDVQIPSDQDSDFELINQYPDIININQLHDQYQSIYSFNELQFMLHANCDSFISVQGGSSILSSCFGGTNIIYAVGGQELVHNSFSWYTKFSNCTVKHAKDFTIFNELINTFK